MKIVRSILKSLGWRYNQIFSIRDRIVGSRVAGRQVKMVNGTARQKEDKDDAWYYALAMNSKQVFDIGANVGYTGLLAALLDNVITVYLVDPNPLALSIAAKNQIINNVEYKCRFFNAFVSNSCGEKVKFYTVGSGEAGSIFKGHAETASALNNFYFVQTVTLDYLSKYFECVPDFVKVDVEGAESMVLEGAMELASQNQSRFMIEMHSPPELPMGENAKRILKWCAKLEYKAWYMKEKVELVDPNTIAHRGKCHLLLQPKSWPYPDFLKSINQGDPIPNQV